MNHFRKSLPNFKRSHCWQLDYFVSVIDHPLNGWYGWSCSWNRNSVCGHRSGLPRDIVPRSIGGDLWLVKVSREPVMQ